MYFKRYLFPFLFCLSCISAYIITANFPSARLEEKEIKFHSAKAGEVILVWGLNGWNAPPANLLPAKSYLKGKQVYTKMQFEDDQFTAKLKLPLGSTLNYCFFLSKDRQLKVLDEWDSNEKQNYELHIENWYFKPGYFILLAGLIPLLLLYFKDDKRCDAAGATPVNSESVSGEYIPQLNSIRALAVLLVMIHHWFPPDYFLNFLPNGALGVNIFFVLSGFLITRILLKQKTKAENENGNKLRSIGNFVMRRSLRIFPIYYLLLLGLLAMGYAEIREHAVYYFTYTANYLFYTRQSYLGYLSHVWSLAAEEQFYLFWPWLILFLPKKLLPYLIGLFIALGISANYIFNEHGWWAIILTPACFDAFGLGALFAYIMVYRSDLIGSFKSVLQIGVVLAVVLFIIELFYPSFIPKRTIHAVLGLWMISYCMLQKNNPVLNAVLNNRFLIFIGEISYGIYLYHLFIPLIRTAIEKKMAAWNIDFLFNHSIPLVVRKEWIFAQEFVFVILLAWLSWILIEKPINSFKSKFV